ncbi:MAG TPA: M14 family metallopeptidase, partial [Gemmatimonadaceae bacterium]|nr:M14 family metallopeptidase [Gemmatimonadaceae bacterium]
LEMRANAVVAPILILAGCSSLGGVPAGPGGEAPSTPASPRTRAELTQYRETSSHADVVAFLDGLQKLGAPMWTGVMGRTTEGREIPYVIASRPLVATPIQARRLGRPVVYVQANIHGGEVEGKEALQALLRDLLMAPGPNVLDSIVLVAVPIYNADGNDAWGPQARNRGSQQGPERIGQRPNGQGLDLNRDYIKAEAPETRATLALIDAWDPDVFVDLHTTNGSLHGYALTYAPSLVPNALPVTDWTRDSLLPELRRRVRDRHGFETFDYGNFSSQDTTRRTWATYDHRPRFGTNYYGLRGRIGILSEAYSHDPFERRVASTRAFVAELLSLIAERGGRILAGSRMADEVTTAMGIGSSTARGVPLRAVLTRTPYTGEVLVEDVERRAGDTTVYEIGMPRGARRTGNIRAVRMPVADRFDATLSERLPFGWAVPAVDTQAVARLRLHGVQVERLTAPWSADVERFRIDSMVVAAREFQGHHEVRLEGEWSRERTELPAGTFIVQSAQPLGVLAFWLLDPRSDDGLLTWNVFRGSLAEGAPFPVVRVVQPLTAPRRLEP